MSNDILNENAPAELRKMVELCADSNRVLEDVDVMLGWEVGTSRRMIRQYPTLAQTVAEARVLALRSAGVDKVTSFRVIAEAHDAMTDTGMPDHDIRLKAADKALALLGEKTAGVGTTVVAKDININITSPEDIAWLDMIASTLKEITDRMNMKKVKTVDAVSK